MASILLSFVDRAESGEPNLHSLEARSGAKARLAINLNTARFRIVKCLKFHGGSDDLMLDAKCTRNNRTPLISRL